MRVENAPRPDELMFVTFRALIVALATERLTRVLVPLVAVMFVAVMFPATSSCAFVVVAVAPITTTALDVAKR